MEFEKNSWSSNPILMPNSTQLIRRRVDRGTSQETWLAVIRRRDAFKLGQTLVVKIQAYSFFNMLANNPRLSTKSENI